MKVTVCKNYAEMSDKAAEIIAEIIRNKPDCLLGLATGGTPEGIYAVLVKMYKEGKLSFADVKSINLDEYYPISPENDQSYRYFMDKHLFNNVNIDKNNTYVPDGSAADPDIEASRYDELAKSLGQVDLQLLGIGRNAHIGFNEPGDYLLAPTHITDLTPSTIAANGKYFPSLDVMPKRALTMGIGTILHAKKILLVASGAEKHDAVKHALSGKVSSMYPATFLALHDDVTLICDEAAYYGDEK